MKPRIPRRLRRGVALALLCGATSTFALNTASIVASGKMDDFEGAKKMLLEWKKAVQPKVYPSHQQAQAADRGDGGQARHGVEYTQRG